MTMTREQQHSLLGIALLAAFADGDNHAREREQIRSFAESLGTSPATADLPALYQRVLLRQFAIADAVASLQTQQLRQLAYELAVCVCDADGRTTPAERGFLAELATALGLEPDHTDAVDRQVEGIAELGTLPASSRTDLGPATGAGIDAAELDRRILNAAILNGALELLPQSWASMAIIPLQIRLVYSIGKDHGYDLDQGHIRELLATLGVGMTSQYIEQFGRKLLGGLFGKVAGGLAGRLGGAATGVAFSFASTYALGQVARRYYSGGRQMSTGLLQQTFQELLGPAKELQSRYLPEVQRKASNLDATQIINIVRGQ